MLLLGRPLRPSAANYSGNWLRRNGPVAQPERVQRAAIEPRFFANLCAELGLARLSINGEVLASLGVPRIAMGRAMITPPPV